MNELILVMNEFLISAAILAGPPLAIATVIGFSLAIFQALTSIQDQTLTQTTKIIAISATLFMMSYALASPLYHSTLKLFDTFHLIL